jgi:type II secretory pathway pseudopilin PulG
MKNRITKIKGSSNILSNNNAIALVTVILVIAILGILAAVAIETTGTDIINAGNYTRSEQTLDIGNSAINMVFAQIGSGSLTSGISGVPIQNEVYFNGLNFTGPLKTLMSPDLANSISDFQQCNGILPRYGYEYTGTYGLLPGNSGYMYNGTIYVIAQKTCFPNEQGSTKTVGATFNYGPISQQPVPTEY